jgi:hypothetical protein
MIIDDTAVELRDARKNRAGLGREAKSSVLRT